jgi:NAD-dependent dihydropyrimidine dehydrogenase PreA subunit
MKRKIILIDQDICNGCGECLPNCPEGALQLIDNKARLVSDLFCDGLGACIGTCPLGAIRIEEREAEPYDEKRVMANIAPQGANVIRAHLDHLAAHNETAYLEQARQYLADHNIPLPGQGQAPSCCSPEPAAASMEPHGCPGSRQQDRRGSEASIAAATAPAAAPSELRTWPVQLQLLNPQASFFDDADLLIAADCVPFAYAAFHDDFVKNKIPVVFCPKLDHTIEQYLDKLTAIFTLHPIRSLHVVHMEVPCCSGTVALVRRALTQSGKQIPLHEYTISLQGQLLEKN